MAGDLLLDTASASLLLLLDGAATRDLLGADDVLQAVREAFVLHSRRQGRVFGVVRESVSGGIFGIKSGDVPAQDLLGFKAAGFWPGNRARGGEAHQATIVLIDPHTGRPQCVIDGNAITTARTGAAGGLGLQSLARQDSATACVFGVGVQARVQLDFALRLVPSLEQVSYLTANQAPDAAFEAAFAGRCRLRHQSAANAAVSASDIVITATPGGGALFDAAAVRPGTHLNCVGTDTRGKRELPPGLLERARIYVDDLPQSTTIGELQWQPALQATEIGDVLDGKAVVGRTGGDITLFDMTGLALQDLTVARMVRTQAEQAGRGLRVPWGW